MFFANLTLALLALGDILPTNVIHADLPARRRRPRCSDNFSDFRASRNKISRRRAANKQARASRKRNRV